MRKKLIVLLAVLMALSTAMFALSMTSFGVGATREGYYGVVNFDEYEDGMKLVRNYNGATNPHSDPFVTKIARYATRGIVQIYNNETDCFARIFRSENSNSQYFALNGFFAKTIPAGSKVSVTITYRLGFDLEYYNATEGIEQLETAPATTGNTKGGNATADKYSYLLSFNSYSNADAYVPIVANDSNYADYAEYRTETFELTLAEDADSFYISSMNTYCSYMDVREIVIKAGGNALEVNFDNELTNNTATVYKNLIPGEKATEYLGGATRIFNGYHASYDLTVATETVEETTTEFLRYTSKSAGNAGSISIFYKDNFIANTEYIVRVEYRVSENFVSQDPNARGLAFVRIGENGETDQQLSGEGTNTWHTAEVTVTPLADTNVIEIFTFALEGEYLDVKSVVIEEIPTITEAYYEVHLKSDFTAEPNTSTVLEAGTSVNHTFGDFKAKDYYAATSLVLTHINDGTDSFLRASVDGSKATQEFFFLGLPSALPTGTTYGYRVVMRVSTGAALEGALSYRPNNNQSKYGFEFDAVASTGFETYEGTWTPSTEKDTLAAGTAATTGARLYVDALSAGEYIDIKSFEIYDTASKVDPSEPRTTTFTTADIMSKFNGMSGTLVGAKLDENVLGGGLKSVAESNSGANYVGLTEDGHIAFYNGTADASGWARIFISTPEVMNNTAYSYKMTVVGRTSNFDGALNLRISNGGKGNNNVATYGMLSLFNEATADENGFKTISITFPVDTLDCDDISIIADAKAGSYFELKSIKVEVTENVITEMEPEVAKQIIYMDNGLVIDTDLTVPAEPAEGEEPVVATTALRGEVARADAGYKFIGWYNETLGLLPAGAVVENENFPAKAVFNATFVKLDMVDGASIRANAEETTPGLEFRTKFEVTNNAIAGNLVYSTMIIPTDKLGDTEFVIDNFTAGKDVLLVTATTGPVHEDTDEVGAYNYFRGAIVNIRPYNYARDFSARGFVTVTYADGTSIKVYADNNATRNIYEVALKAYADRKAEADEVYANDTGDGFSRFTTEELAIIKGFIDGVVNLTADAEGNLTVANPYEGLEVNYAVTYVAPYQVEGTTISGADWSMYTLVKGVNYRASVLINGVRVTATKAVAGYTVASANEIKDGEAPAIGTLTYTAPEVQA